MIKHPPQLLLGFVGGVATAAILSFIAPIVSQTARPIAKALLKQSFLTVERLRTMAARGSESLEDLVAEVRAEVERELHTEPDSGHEAAAMRADSDDADALVVQPARRETMS